MSTLDTLVMLLLGLLMVSAVVVVAASFVVGSLNADWLFDLLAAWCKP